MTDKKDIEGMTRLDHCPIMEVTCTPEGATKDGEPIYLLWFVAMSGYHGPQLRIPLSLLAQAKTAIERALGDAAKSTQQGKGE